MNITMSSCSPEPRKLRFAIGQTVYLPLRVLSINVSASDYETIRATPEVGAVDLVNGLNSDWVEGPVDAFIELVQGVMRQSYGVPGQPKLIKDVACSITEKTPSPCNAAVLSKPASVLSDTTGPAARPNDSEPSSASSSKRKWAGEPNHFPSSDR